MVASVSLQPDSSWSDTLHGVSHVLLPEASEIRTLGQSIPAIERDLQYTYGSTSLEFTHLSIFYTVCPMQGHRGLGAFLGNKEHKAGNDP